MQHASGSGPTVYSTSVLKFYACQTRLTASCERDLNELSGLHAVPDNRGAYSCTLQGDRLADCHPGCPMQNSCGKSDRIAVVCLIIKNRLNVCCCPIRLVNRGPTLRSQKTAQN